MLKSSRQPLVFQGWSVLTIALLTCSMSGKMSDHLQ